MARKQFPNDTQDYGEKAFAHLILPHFPRYGQFWEEFIGGKYAHGAGTLVPYPVNFAAHIPQNQRDHLRSLLQSIRVAHYTIFARLVWTHRVADKLAVPPQTDDELFTYLDALERFYIYLGNAWFCYKDELGESCLESACPGGSFLKHVSKMPHYAPLISQFQNGPLLLRNNLVHFGRHAVLVTAGAVLIPMPIVKNPLWDSVVGRNAYARVDALAAHHLTETEQLFNALHDESSRLLRQGLSAKGATLDYS